MSLIKLSHCMREHCQRVRVYLHQASKIHNLHHDCGASGCNKRDWDETCAVISCELRGRN